MRAKYKKRKNASLKIIFLSILIVILILAVGIFIINEKYKIKVITVEGNIHYSNQEIIDKDIDNHISQNSLFLSWRYNNKPIKDIPFIQTMDIRIINPKLR